MKKLFFLRLFAVFLVLSMLVTMSSGCKKKGVVIDDEEGGAIDISDKDTDTDSDSDADTDSDNNTPNNNNTNNDNNNSSNNDNNNSDNTGNNTNNDTGNDNNNNNSSSDDEALKSITDFGKGTKIKVLFQNVLYDGWYNNTTKQRNIENHPGTKVAWASRRPTMKQVLTSYDADSMGFTEVTPGQIKDIQEDFPEYAPFGERRYGDDYKGDRSNELDLIMYKKSVFKLVAKKSATYWLSDTPTVKASKPGFGETNPATVVCALLEHKTTGEQIMHYNTHYSHDGDMAAKTKQGFVMSTIIEDFIEANPEIPIYASGDYNVNSKTEAYSHMASVLDDAFSVAKKKESRFGTAMNTVTAINQETAEFLLKPTNRIDFIFVSGDLMVVDLMKNIEDDVNGYNCSDHYGIFLETRIHPYGKE